MGGSIARAAASAVGMTRKARRVRESRALVDTALASRGGPRGGLGEDNGSSARVSGQVDAADARCRMQREWHGSRRASATFRANSTACPARQEEVRQARALAVLDQTCTPRSDTSAGVLQ